MKPVRRCHRHAGFTDIVCFKRAKTHQADLATGASASEASLRRAIISLRSVPRVQGILTSCDEEAEMMDFTNRDCAGILLLLSTSKGGRILSLKSFSTNIAV
jgi:hypothetical protein